MCKNETNDIITIVVAIYNVKDYIKQCVESLIHQTYQNLQILLVDDGSTDGSAEICDEFANANNQITVLHKENGGLSSARNHGIEHAIGKYICFVDGDDYVNIQMYELLHKTIKETGTSIAECYSQKFIDGQELPSFMNAIAPYNTIVLDRDSWHLQTNLGEFISCVAWNKIYLTSLFKEIRYPLGMIHEDEATTFKLIEQVSTISRIDAKLYYYRQRNGSTVHSPLSPKKIEDKIKSFQIKVDYFESVGNIKVESFVRAKLCIVFMSLYKQLKKDSNPYCINIKEMLLSNYKKIIFKLGVPLKYKAAITLFIVRHYFD